MTTTQDLIEEILSKNSQLSREQLIERLAAERARLGGLLEDETLLRLIAAKFGVCVKQNSFHNSGVLSTSRLFAGLNDVTVAGHLVAVFPVKTFEGAEKSGKFATLILADSEGLLRVVLWNEKADLIAEGKLIAGQSIKLLHGYTRLDRFGKTELHLSSKSQIEVEAKAKTSDHPSLEKFATKINALNNQSSNVLLCGVVTEVFSKKTFTRGDQSDGSVLRFVLADDSGKVGVVAWDEKAMELEKNLRVNAHLLLVNARVKEAPNGGLEVHIDSNTAFNFT
ncbi:MAG: OB-fold nucleic acid binding domain-containing protein [Candidatus Bathyarchaeota archaeon]|nr:OB-fold nucleic acid binding domain-containing protein [Candidatus Bathyarchaeota archaeon]